MINNMTESPFKDRLDTYENGFLHRGGGTLLFPEEAVESTMAGAKMGTGILECDTLYQGPRPSLSTLPLWPVYNNQHPHKARVGSKMHHTLHTSQRQLTRQHAPLYQRHNDRTGSRTGFTASAKTSQDCEPSLLRLTYDHYCNIPTPILKMVSAPFQKLQMNRPI
jgi:hypothetical protein